MPRAPARSAVRAWRRNSATRSAVSTGGARVVPQQGVADDAAVGIEDDHAAAAPAMAQALTSAMPPASAIAARSAVHHARGRRTCPRGASHGRSARSRPRPTRRARAPRRRRSRPCTTASTSRRPSPGSRAVPHGSILPRGERPWHAPSPRCPTRPTWQFASVPSPGRRHVRCHLSSPPRAPHTGQWKRHELPPTGRPQARAPLRIRPHRFITQADRAAARSRARRTGGLPESCAHRPCRPGRRPPAATATG